MTHKGGRLLSTLVCFLFSYLTLTNEGVNEPPLSKISESFSAKKRSLTINVEISLLLTTLKNKKYA
jgi:hypothetical protein